MISDKMKTGSEITTGYLAHYAAQVAFAAEGTIMKEITE